jgi:alpha-mannosidase
MKTKNGTPLFAKLLLAAAVLMCLRSVEAMDTTGEFVKQVQAASNESVTGWKFRLQDIPNGADPKLDDSGWQAVPNDDDAWRSLFSRPDAICWYRTRVTIPAVLYGTKTQGRKISLVVDLWPAGDIYVNGAWVKQCNTTGRPLQDESQRVPLPPNARSGEVVSIAIKAYPHGNAATVLKNSRLELEGDAWAGRVHNFLGDLGIASALLEDAGGKSDGQILNITKTLDLEAMRRGNTEQFDRSLAAAQEGLRGLLKQNPRSHLQVLIVPHSHADLSWPDTPEVCTNLNVQAIAKSIAILEKSPDFKFSEEDGFVLQEFLRRYPEQEETVRDLLRRDILGCGGFYIGPSELLLGGEGLVRNLYFGKRWMRERFGLNTEFAWNVDEPGHTLQMPQILAKAGIKNFVIWKVLVRKENNLNVSGYAGPAVFRWAGPDGSQVMVAHCPESYGAGDRLRTQNYAVAEAGLESFVEKEIAQVKKWMLPPVILMADGSDCSIPDEAVRVNACEWNARHDVPKVKLASVNEYFQACENELGRGNGEVRTVVGEIPCWWDGTQSVENDAFMLSRHTEQRVTAAEKVSAINSVLMAGYDYPRSAINSVWQGNLLVHEHNWGGHNGIISDAVKLARARDSQRVADETLSGSLDALISHIRCRDRGIPLVVFNPLSWPRTDVVDYVLSVAETGTRALRLLDAEGQELPVQVNVQATHADGSIARAQVVFEASVPSLGYATYYFVAGKSQVANPLRATATSLENQFYRASLDGNSGGITGIFDKSSGREILNTGKYQANELIALQNLGVDEAEEFTGRWWRMSDKPASITVTESGPVRATIQVKGTLLNSTRIQEISIYRTLPRIDLKTILVWDGQKEIQVNTTFPFRIAGGNLTYEVPFGSVQYGKESAQAMACHPTVRGANNWVDLSNDQLGVTLATEVTPFDVKDRTDPRFHDARTMKGESEPSVFSIYYNGRYRSFDRIALQDPMLLKTDFVIQPILLRSVFSCGDRDLYFTQPGPHAYRFALQTHRGPLVPHDAVRLGWAHNAPLLVRRGQTTTGDLPEQQSFLDVSAANVVVTILKKAEDGRGLLLRCYETDGRDTRVTLRGPKGLVGAMSTDILEEDQKPIRVNADGSIDIPVGKYAIETVRLLYK